MVFSIYVSGKCKQSYETLEEAMKMARLTVVDRFTDDIKIQESRVNPNDNLWKKTDQELTDMFNCIKDRGVCIYEDPYIEKEEYPDYCGSVCECTCKGVRDVLRYKNMYLMTHEDLSGPLHWEDMTNLYSWIKNITGYSLVWDKFVRTWYINKEKHREYLEMRKRTFESNKKAMIQMKKDGVEFPSIMNGNKFRLYPIEELEKLTMEHYYSVIDGKTKPRYREEYY